MLYLNDQKSVYPKYRVINTVELYAVNFPLLFVNPSFPPFYWYPDQEIFIAVVNEFVFSERFIFLAISIHFILELWQCTKKVCKN